MRYVALLSLASLSLGAGPITPPTHTRDITLYGTWTLMHVEWMGERTDQADVYSEFDDTLGKWISVAYRQRIAIEKDRFVFLQDRTSRWKVASRWESPYRIERQGGRMVLEVSQTNSLLHVSGDTLRLCHHEGNQRLPSNVASDPNDPDVVVLVYQRGDFSRRIVRVSPHYRA